MSPCSEQSCAPGIGERSSDPSTLQVKRRKNNVNKRLAACVVGSKGVQPYGPHVASTIHPILKHRPASHIHTFKRSSASILGESRDPLQACSNCTTNTLWEGLPMHTLELDWIHVDKQMLQIRSSVEHQIWT